MKSNLDKNCFFDISSKLAINSENVNCICRKNGDTPLLVAIYNYRRYGQEMISYLLSLGANVNLSNANNGITEKRFPLTEIPCSIGNVEESHQLGVR